MSGFPREDYRLLEPYAPDRRPVEVDLSDNTNQWGPHPAALAALRNAAPEGLTRYPSVYADEVKRAVARRYGVPEESVATGCGSDDLLDSAFRSVSAAGGKVAYMDPTFSMIPIFARMNGLASVAIPWDEAVDDPERLVAGDPDAVYVCAPNNPTGLLPPAGWLDRLLDAGGAEGPVIVLDEAYAEFAGRSELPRAPHTDRLLVLRTLSKAFGLAGLRVGFAVGPRTVVAEVEKSRGPYKVGRIDEEAAIRALEDPDGWIDGIVEKTLTNRARLARELEARGYLPLPSRGNFVFLPMEAGTAEDVTAGLRSRGVAVRPFPGLAGTGDGIRVTVGPWEMLERFLAALDDAISSGAAPLEAAGRKQEERGTGSDPVRNGPEER